MKGSIESRIDIIIAVGKAAEDAHAKTLADLAAFLSVERRIHCALESLPSLAVPEPRRLYIGTHSEWLDTEGLWPRPDGYDTYVGLICAPADGMGSQEIFEQLNAAVSFVLFEDASIDSQAEALADLLQA